MTAPEPVAGPADHHRPAAGARREYLLTLLAGAVGAAVVLLAARQDWARVVTIEPHPLPASRVAVSGQDLVPAAGALGLAALAGLAAVLATRGLVRRIVGGLLTVFGVAIIASVSLPVTAARVRDAAVGATTAQAGSVPGGSTVGSTVGSGTTPGTGGSGVAGLSLASHVEMAAFPWRWAVLLGGLLVLGAGMLVAWRGTRWPVMSSRYERPASRKPPAVTDPASLWESLSQGLDPTDHADPAGPGPAAAGSAAAGSGAASPSSGIAPPSSGTAPSSSGAAPDGNGSRRGGSG